MFNWFSKSPAKTNDGLLKIKADFIEMLRAAQREFHIATDVALCGVSADSAREEVLQKDKQVNKAERNIRKGLVIHCSVRGSITPESLVMMSIAKDAERLGDYAKNIFDLGALPLAAPCGDDKERLLILKKLIEQVFADCIAIIRDQSEEAATKLIRDAAWISRQCENNTVRLLQLETPNNRTAADVLMYRYMKRVVLHLRNICSSIVQPVHKLDFTSKLTKDLDVSGDLLDRSVPTEE